MSELKLTESADERKFRNFFLKNCVYHIPLFQRPYRWMPAKIDQFQRDLLTTLESEDDLHFMGAIIFHRISGNFPDVDEYEIIDGQQRITTILLHLAAAAMVLSSSEEGATDAWKIVVNYLINNEFNIGQPATIKLQPSREDREPLNDVMKKLISSPGIASASQSQRFQIAYLQETAPTPSTRIAKNFALAQKFFRDQHREGGNQLVWDLVETMMSRLAVVVIEVVDPLSGPKIFDSLNSQQEPMTVGDLVRNDVFAKVGKDSIYTLDDIEHQHWKPFFESFGDPRDGHFENYFFPYGLINNPNTKKAEVYQLLRKRWAEDGLDAIEVIAELKEFQPDYMVLRNNVSIPEHPNEVQSAFRRLYELGSPTACYPFAMRLSNEVRQGGIDPAECVRILKMLDSFFTRRAVLGQEPTGLHAVFKRLWLDAEALGGVTANNVEVAILNAKTVQWPSQAEFMTAIRERNLYKVRITDYVLSEMNRMLGGDAPSGFAFWTEHVLPQNPAQGWETFSAEQRKSLTDRLANLLPLTSEMNQALSNSPYEAKRPVFKDDSMYKMTRQFAEAYSEWTAETLQARSEELAELAVERWPYGPFGR